MDPPLLPEKSCETKLTPRSWTKKSTARLVSAATRLEADESKATKRPPELMLGRLPPRVP
jgi:hypothetical protein